MSGADVGSTSRRDARRHLAGYLVVGVLSYAIDVGLLVMLRDRAGASLFVATTVGFWSSVLFNFLANRWVFGAAEQHSATAHAVRYLVLLAVNYGLTLAIVGAGVALGADAVLAKTLAVGLIACSNFFFYRRWVFARAA